MNTEENKQLEIAGLSSIPLLKYLKYPAFLKEELYERYPSGGEFGWYAYVEELKGFACWSTELEDWILGTGTGGVEFHRHNTTLTGVTSISEIKMGIFTIKDNEDELNIFENRLSNPNPTITLKKISPARCKLTMQGRFQADYIETDELTMGYWSLSGGLSENLVIFNTDPDREANVVISTAGTTNVGRLKVGSWLFSESLNGDLLISSINQRDIVMSGVRLADLAFGSYTINRVNNELKIKFDDVDLIVMDESGQVRIPNLVTT